MRTLLDTQVSPRHIYQIKRTICDTDIHLTKARWPHHAQQLRRMQPRARWRRLFHQDLSAKGSKSKLLCHQRRELFMLGSPLGV